MQNERANRCGQEPEPEPEPADDDDEDVCSVCFAGPCAWGMSRFGCAHKFCGDCIRGTLDAVSCCVTISLASGLHSSPRVPARLLSGQALTGGDFPGRCPVCKMEQPPGDPPPGVSCRICCCTVSIYSSTYLR